MSFGTSNLAAELSSRPYTLVYGTVLVVRATSVSSCSPIYSSHSEDQLMFDSESAASEVGAAARYDKRRLRCRTAVSLLFRTLGMLRCPAYRSRIAWSSSSPRFESCSLGFPPFRLNCNTDPQLIHFVTWRYALHVRTGLNWDYAEELSVNYSAKESSNRG